MINLEKAKLLKQLYQYKSFGFEYFQDNQTLGTTQNQPSVNSLDELEHKVKQCHLCQLAKSRKNIVFGEGDEHATLLFVGEGPGANEDESGRPFVGRAGMLLTKIIENVLELTREDVYITNIVKCRPPNNRVPSVDEASVCKPYLMEQIAIIKPKIIVALGSTSYHYLTEDYDMPISKIRGEILEFGDAKLIPTYHPSFLLRNPSAKKEVYADMLKVKRLL
ncbi:uracil-DNA glycosylase [Sulfurospirillum sp. 1612]|uniref:uracil-DNA glycosylase n=1 Tax=Sulfurospirillum sp. 1612 TaxID=3094835 RepID=UPI002F91DC09